MPIGTFKDIMEDHRHGNYNFTINGKCSNCGSCCSNILPISEREIAQIKAYMKRHGIIQQKHGTNVLAKPVLDMECPFLDHSKELKCTIYPVRPLICREFICTGKRFIPSKDVVKEVLNGKVQVRNVAKTFFEEEDI